MVYAPTAPVFLSESDGTLVGTGPAEFFLSGRLDSILTRMTNVRGFRWVDLCDQKLPRRLVDLAHAGTSTPVIRLVRQSREPRKQ